MTHKEFEIFNRPERPFHRAVNNNNSHLGNLQQNLYFYIGHQEKKPELNHLFNYDLGQVILSKGRFKLFFYFNKI